MYVSSFGFKKIMKRSESFLNEKVVHFGVFSKKILVKIIIIPKNYSIFENRTESRNFFYLIRSKKGFSLEKKC